MFWWIRKGFYCCLYIFFCFLVLVISFSIHFYQTEEISSFRELAKQWIVHIGRKSREFGFQDLEVVEIPLDYPNLPFNEFKIAMISDLHFDPVESDSLNHKEFQKAIDKINEINPDIVVVTGDFITWDLKGDEKISRWLGEINCPRKYGVFGSHDYYFFGRRNERQRKINKDRFSKKLKRYANLEILENEYLEIFPNFIVVGYGDPLGDSFKPQNIDLSKFSSSKKFVLALTHNPDTFPCLFENKTCSSGIPDLGLAGHTHGGQIRIFGVPIAKFLRSFLGFDNVVKNWKYSAGLITFKDSHKKYAYVNRGIGGHLNIRIGCRPELTIFKLNMEKKKKKKMIL